MMNNPFTLETIALWWCYAFGAVTASALLIAAWLWLVNQVVTLFNVKRAIIDWVWNRAKGYELRDPRSDMIEGAKFAKDLAGKQQPLGEPFTSVLSNHVWDLYARDERATKDMGGNVSSGFAGLPSHMHPTSRK